MEYLNGAENQNPKGFFRHFVTSNRNLTRQTSNRVLFLSAKENMAPNLLLSLVTIFISSIFAQPRALQYPQDLFSFTDFIIPTSSPTSSTSVSPTPPFPETPPLVPAFFVIGDSSVDCGTNNFLATLARADRLPYGRDFDTQLPTGRFCNGRVPVDFLGKYCFLFFLFFLFSFSGDPFVWLMRKWRKRK